MSQRYRLPSKYGPIVVVGFLAAIGYALDTLFKWLQVRSYRKAGKEPPKALADKAEVQAQSLLGFVFVLLLLSGMVWIARC